MECVTQNYYTHGICHFYYNVQYIRKIIFMECVTSISLWNTSELLCLRNVSLLLHCALYHNYYTYGMCHSYYTVHYIITIILMECVTLITLCNTSELLQSRNVSLLLNCAIYHLYSSTTSAIYYVHVTLQCVTSVTQPNVPFLL